MYSMKDIDTITAVCDLYKEGATVRDVASAAHISANVVSDILRERGLIRPRGVRAMVSVASFTRTCPSCGNTKHLPGAAFCMSCGSLLATKKELAAESINRVRVAVAANLSDAVAFDRIKRDIDAVAEYISGCKEE